MFASFSLWFIFLILTYLTTYLSVNTYPFFIQLNILNFYSLFLFKKNYAYLFAIFINFVLFLISFLIFQKQYLFDNFFLVFVIAITICSLKNKETYVNIIPVILCFASLCLDIRYRYYFFSVALFFSFFYTVRAFIKSSFLGLLSVFYAGVFCIVTLVSSFHELLFIIYLASFIFLATSFIAIYERYLMNAIMQIIVASSCLFTICYVALSVELYPAIFSFGAFCLQLGMVGMNILRSFSLEQELEKMGGIWMRTKINWLCFWLCGAHLLLISYHFRVISVLLNTTYCKLASVVVVVGIILFIGAFVRLGLNIFHGTFRNDEHIFAHIKDASFLAFFPILLLFILFYPTYATFNVSFLNFMIFLCGSLWGGAFFITDKEHYFSFKNNYFLTRLNSIVPIKFNVFVLDRAAQLSTYHKHLSHVPHKILLFIFFVITAFLIQKK